MSENPTLFLAAANINGTKNHIEQKCRLERAGENVWTNCIPIVIHHRKALQCSAPIPPNQSHLSRRNEENGVTNDSDCLKHI